MYMYLTGVKRHMEEEDEMNGSVENREEGEEALLLAVEGPSS